MRWLSRSELPRPDVEAAPFALAELVVKQIVGLGQVGHLHVLSVSGQFGHRYGTSGATPPGLWERLADSYRDVAEQNDLGHQACYFMYRLPGEQNTLYDLR